ncbi:hypothetical protein [Lactiplantibacillus plantarum]|uniref:hypothetical protein n=1 Tax=Lactiplantibacillus plantarum TaxID=1590 RepID=UPI000FEE36B7|nr:hypothetical protein [Lactiplantibacillus plantarum]RWZ42594.1 hypothetical protein EQG58_16360 [Lactiplantibacillus plantarum]
MAIYSDDREFTDYVHTNLAIPIIYSKMNWKPIYYSDTYVDQRDKKDGIDYQAIDNFNLKITIQERFRDEYAKKYNDFTIRYTRNSSSRPEEKRSEWFKIAATYLIYGITNGKKFTDTRHTLTDFVKYIVVDLQQIRNLVRDGIIKIPENFNNFSQIKIENGKRVLYTAKKRNPDHSSEFIAIDPKLLIKIIGDSINLVVLDQKGFY